MLLVIIGAVSICRPAFSGDMQDYGRIWKAWGRKGQTAYLWGFIDGGGCAMQAVMDEIISSDKPGNKIPSTFYDNIRDKTATLYDEAKLIDVISKLYEEPANSYIWFQDMVYIARDSLSGKDVTASILKARKAAVTNYELNEKMKGK